MSIMSSQVLVRAAVGTFGMALCAGLCLAGAAAAEPAINDNTRMQVVSRADLDLSSPQGRATLDCRIKAAARAVCDIRLFGDAVRWLRRPIKDARES